MSNVISKAFKIINCKVKARQERRLFNRNIRKGIVQRYKRLFGIELDLDNPKTFAEKIHWLKLNDRNDRIVQCADKYVVRDFVKNSIGEQYLVPIFGVWDRGEEVDFSRLPKSFVLKPNNSSGRVLICKDKAKLNVKKAKRILRSWEKENLTKETGEWVYEKIPFKIICETFLEDNITDYKLYYADGQFIATQVILDRATGNRSFLYMDKDWNKLDIRRRGAQSSTVIPIKPKLYEEMIRIADKLSRGFAFCRIDLYYVADKIYFGEISFYPNNGFVCYETQQMDEFFSAPINLLSVEKYNG